MYREVVMTGSRLRLHEQKSLPRLPGQPAGAFLVRPLRL